MSERIECGTQMGFGVTGRCGTCHVAWLNPSEDVPMVSSVEASQQRQRLRSSGPTAKQGSTPAATAFTSLAWVIVGLSFICTLIATFVTFADGKSFLAIIVFVSGCFSAVFLGLLAEISANVARLVNKSR